MSESGHDQPQNQIDLADAYAVKTPQDSRRLYAQWAQTYNETFINANKYVYPRAVAELFAKHVSEIAITAVVDIGCGTGAVGSYLANLRPEITIDGYDISPEMLAQAALTRRVDNSPVYRNLLEVDLTASLPKQTFDAMTTAGTFTHGHLGPETLVALIDLVRVDGWFVIGVNAEHFEARGFASVINNIVKTGVISQPEIHVVNVYEVGSPHYGDCAKVNIFQRKK